MSTSQHGYFKYTDLIFNYSPNAGEHAEVLKAFFFHESLTDPGCPLRKADQDGIELFLGEWTPPGKSESFTEKHLLFSTDQLEYIRYYLLKVGYTHTPVSLPPVEMFLHDDSFKSITPTIICTTQDFRKIRKSNEKHNKAARKGRTPGSPGETLGKQFPLRELQAARDSWAWAEKGVGAFLSIDFESYEFDHSKVTEWGWAGSRFIPRTDETSSFAEKIESGHLIAGEHLHLQNKVYVAGNRDHFLFGESEIIPTSAELQSRLKDLIEKWEDFAKASGGPLHLVFHDASADLAYFQTCGINTDRIAKQLALYLSRESATGLSPREILTADTKVMYDGCVMEAKSTTKQRNLKVMCEDLGIQPDRLHNAGNDAYFTLEGFKAMAKSTNPVQLMYKEPSKAKVEDFELM
ncbi:Ribonuclease H-like domain [Phaffia rhodozyma]|uniref:Ribonuclease H-like domain n=1 Tax=Phaffia rhodozyma TaxID=264483 RepID=A0A0F7SXL6_PHARH|nr:Ribonuclease H-like domain [Phaffia rhodozyma]